MFAGVLTFVLGVASPCQAQDEFFDLRLAEASGEAQSTVVKLPIAFVLKKRGETGIGVRLRTPVYFSWNRVAITDIGGKDIAHSLNTLTITPGVELEIPAWQEWLIRPFAEVGAVSALGLGEQAWMVAAGCRFSAIWDRERWRYIGGGRLQYSVGLTDKWRLHDDLASVEIGGGASLPLWFETSAGRPRAGFFVFPRWYFDNFAVDGADDGGLAVDYYTEIGASFEWPERPKILGIKLPAWYGLGYRFANNYGAVRIYLGFPF